MFSRSVSKVASKIQQSDLTAPQVLKAGKWFQSRLQLQGLKQMMAKNDVSAFPSGTPLLNKHIFATEAAFKAAVTKYQNLRHN